jgi:hypothetical protein
MQLMVERLKPEVVPAPAVSEEDIRAQFATITLRTIRIRRGPGDRMEEAEAAARERAKELLQRIRDGADFADLAATASEDERYKERAGLGEPVLVASLNPDRLEAVASLEAGGVSQLIQTDSGYEILRVEARGFDLPEDYEESKPELGAKLAAQRQEQAWQEHVQAMHDAAEIVVTDSELLAYERLEGDDWEGALPLMADASRDAERLGPSGATSVFFKLGARYSVLERWEDATDAYASCDHYVSQVLHLFPGGRISTLFGLGHTYENLAAQLREEGQSARADEASSRAVTHYQEAARHTSSPSHHDRLRLAYERLGRPDLAEQEAHWLRQHQSMREAQRKARQERRGAQ